MLGIYLLVGVLALWLYSRYVRARPSRGSVCGSTGYPKCWPVVTSYENHMEAVELMGRLNTKLMYFLEYLREKYHVGESEDTIAEEGPEHAAGYDPLRKTYVEHLLLKYNYEVIQENDPRVSNSTSFTISKGVAMHLCLRRKENPEELIDDHTLFFVLLHEISHIANYSSIGHGPTFWRVFKFILEEARLAGIHEPAKYAEAPVEYCGLTVDYSPYWDPTVQAI